MTRITTRIVVAADGSISTATPLPAGEHVANIDVFGAPARQPAAHPFDLALLPVLDLGPWPKGLSLSREVMYGDDGR